MAGEFFGLQNRQNLIRPDRVLGRVQLATGDILKRRGYRFFGFHDQGYACYFSDFIGCNPGITSRYNDGSPGVDSDGPADQLTGLIIRSSCHGAGVDNVIICCRVKGNDGKAPIFQLFQDTCRLILVDLATQCGHGYFHEYGSSSSCAEYLNVLSHVCQGERND